jgi:hypothetical protein
MYLRRCLPQTPRGNILIGIQLINRNVFPLMQELQKSMYYGDTPGIFERAFQLCS